VRLLLLLLQLQLLLLLLLQLLLLLLQVLQSVQVVAPRWMTHIQTSL
jgi:hypothetical protein